jgi:transposase
VLHRWRDEAVQAGGTITRIALAFEAGRDGFWLARWLEARGVEAHVIHPSRRRALTTMRRTAEALRVQRYEVRT